MELTSFDASGSNGVPPTDLSAGVLFWRAYARSAGTTAPTSTPTWQFTVGARSAPVDSSWGTTLDVNGDGYADVIFAGQSIYLGGAAGLASTPAVTLSEPGGFGNDGYVMASAGDVNGDGYDDVIVGDPLISHRVFLYLGGPTGLASAPAVTLVDQNDSQDDFGISAASAGDVNGDGYADVVVGEYVEELDSGSVFVYLGGQAGLSTTPAVKLDDPANGPDNCGGALAGAGDVNGDGYADVVVGAYTSEDFAGQAYMYLGGPNGLVAAPSTALTGPVGGESGFGGSVASAGDVNGDGYADVIVGAYTAEDAMGDVGVGQATVYFGSAGGLSAAAAVILADPVGMTRNGGEEFGSAVAGVGDVNGDGYDDVAVSVGAVDVNPSAYVYFGGPSGPPTMPSVGLAVDGGDSELSLPSMGDVNGDGYADIVLGDSPASNTYLYLGTSNGPISSASAVLDFSP